MIRHHKNNHSSIIQLAAIFPLLCFTLSSCTEGYTKDQQLVIDYVKSMSLDEKTFEVIEITTQEYKLSDEKKKEIKEIREGIEDFKKLETLKVDISMVMNVYSFNNPTITEGLDQWKEFQLKYQSSKEKYGENDQLTEFYRIAIERNPESYQMLFATNPSFGYKKIEEVQKEIETLQTSNINNEVLHLIVYLRYYNVNRLGTRGVNEATFEILPSNNEEGLIGFDRIMSVE